MSSIGQLTTAQGVNGLPSLGGSGGTPTFGMGSSPHSVDTTTFGGEGKKEKKATWKKVLIAVVTAGGALALCKFLHAKWRAPQMEKFTKAYTGFGETLKTGKGDKEWANYVEEHIKEISSHQKQGTLTEELAKRHKSPQEQKIAEEFYNCYLAKGNESVLKTYFSHMKDFPKEAQEALLTKYTGYHNSGN